MIDNVIKTKEVYRLLWKKVNSRVILSECHFDEMQELIPETIVKGERGIDIGSGCGYDTYFMAKNNPSVKILSLDISEGIYKAKEIASGLRNVWFVKGSILEMPIKDNTFDFAYSFGVLHHTPDPKKGIREIANVIKKGAYVYLYLYEDHSDNYPKYIAIKVIAMLRKVTVRISPKALYLISYLFSPFIMFLFCYPARVLKKFKLSRSLSDKIPFNFGTHPFSLAGDLYDRFSVPIEHRFSRNEIIELLTKNGFGEIEIKKFKSKAGWVVRASKIND